MATLRFEVPAPFASWTADSVEYPPGETTLEGDDVTPEIVRLASISHEQGILIVHEGLEDGHVQSQEDGEAANAAAVEDGTWHEGQIVQTALDAIGRERVKLAEAQVMDERNARIDELVGDGVEPAEAKAQAEVEIPAPDPGEYEDAVDPAEVLVKVLDAKGRVSAVSAADILAAHEHVWNPPSGGEDS